MENKYDVIIVGTGAAGLFAALNFPIHKKILMITKSQTDKSDSFLAQGGICVLKDGQDYDSYFEDTMHAGHYENRKESVHIMLRSSQNIISDLIGYGVEFAMENGNFLYTREGAHSSNRILFHEDITGKEITSKLLSAVLIRNNITVMENTTMIDLLCYRNICFGVRTIHDNECTDYYSDYTILATGGLGGLFENSTNFRHLTADALAVALKHNIQLENLDYIQIHPTTLYSETPGRRFLISESVRGEGALLYGKDGKRFVNELLPRDVVTNAINEQMQKDNMAHVWLSMEKIQEDVIKSHFPNIYRQCLTEGYDVTKQWIPVVPSQHYFMGGIHVDRYSKTTMDHLYAVGETSCNGVHGANRLASNSLLESLVFAKRAACHIIEHYQRTTAPVFIFDPLITIHYEELAQANKKLVLDAIEHEKAERKKNNE